MFFRMEYKIFFISLQRVIKFLKYGQQIYATRC